MNIILIGIIALFLIELSSGEKLISSSKPKLILSEVIDATLLEHHEITLEQLGDALHQNEDEMSSINLHQPHLYLVCGSFQKKQDTDADDWMLHEYLKINKNTKIAHVNNVDRRLCTLSHLHRNQVSDMKLGNKQLQIHKYPTFFKIHHSLMNYLSHSLLKQAPMIWSQTMRKQRKIESKKSKKDHELMAEGSILSIEVSPLALQNNNNKDGAALQEIFNRLLHDISTPMETHTKTDHSNGWKEVMKNHAYDPTHVQCSLPSSAEISFVSHSIHITDLSQLSNQCIIHIIHRGVHYSEVMRILIHPRPVLMNYEARGLTQSGRIHVEPYRDAGITGTDQICGVGDSGVNDISCFFLDDSKAYPTVTTIRNGELQPNRRKIIQYTAYADGTEDEAGHGTHVCGSIAGNSNGPELSDIDGMAPHAKIAIFDLGMTDKEYLKVPAVSEIFDTAYDAGARVHSDSWGNFGGIYGQMSYDVDSYLSENEDFLTIFAAGNSGHDGANTIIAPGNAKNCLSVGAAQNRGVMGDKPFDDSTSRVASFSSLGPTFDGRIKPDVVAPGDYIMSAFAGPTVNLNAALSPGSKADSTCAAHQMSGTSMATPVTAGTALLVRQYFMDANHWGRACKTLNSYCIKGAFEPSGFLLKGLFLHSGRPIHRYSDPAYDAEPTAFASFLLSAPPDPFQGYGFVTLSNILPLESGNGLNPKLKLVVYDWLSVKAHQTYKSTITFESADIEVPIKVTIAWFDPPSVIGSVTSLLIHDIDLVVRTPEGTLHWGNENSAAHDSSLHKHGHGDTKNPNEQVFIAKPKCAGTCTYDVFIRAHSLFAKQTQNVALIVTSSGTVSDPVLTNEQWFGPDVDETPRSRHHNMTYTPVDVQLATTLKGAEFTSTSFTVSTCGHLRLVEATLTYNHLHCGPGEAIPGNIEVTLQAPSGKAVSIGGQDSSVGKAKITTEWPDSWNTDISGVYTALIDLTDAKIYGAGSWTLYIMNSYSGSGKVSYDFSAQLLFYGGANESCAPTAAPTSTVISKDPYKIPQDDLLSEFHTAFEVPFHVLPLGVKQAHSTAASSTTNTIGMPLTQDRVIVASFPYSAGTLTSVKLSLNAYDNFDYETFGTDAWLLAVVVTAPDEKTTVQVGGYHWLGRKDNFYYRHWPDLWLGRLSAGLKWQSSRDVSAAGLSGSYNGGGVSIRQKGLGTQGKWVVELAMGSNYPRTPVNFTGTVTLMFENKECAITNSCEKNVIRLNTLSASRTPTPVEDHVGGYHSKHLLSALLNPLNILCLVLIYLGFVMILRMVQYFKKPPVTLSSSEAVRSSMLVARAESGGTSYGSVHTVNI